MIPKNILILFPLEHIAFSPTTLGIYDALAMHSNVTIFCPKTLAFKVDNIGNRQVQYFDLNSSKQRKIKALPLFLMEKIKNVFFKSSKLGHLKIYDFVRYLEYKKVINNIDLAKYDEIIAVDILMLAIVSSLGKCASFLSLELNDNEIPLLRYIPSADIKAVIIQTENRYQHLFGNKVHPTFLVQNAPIYKDIVGSNKIKNSIVFNGTATAWFGLYHSLEFVKSYPQYSMTFKGAMSITDKQHVIDRYPALVSNGNIIFNKDYMETDKMLAFLATHEIGFCFYDLAFPHMNTFNYKTAPSGKMFAYLAAGVPVIGNKLEGLKVIEDFNAGILVSDFNPDTILQAVNLIKNNYEFYRSNCIKAAEHYSFDKRVKPYVDFLLASDLR